MRDVYDECLRTAAACARDRHDASDLVQTIFLYALEHGLPDLGAPERRAWLRGALRRRAAFEARLAARRHKREACWQDVSSAGESQRPWRFSPEFLASLQPSIRVLAALATADLSPEEIRSVLRLSGTAFRKRLSELRRVVRDASQTGLTLLMQGSSSYALGPARAGLIDSLRRRPEAVLGSHDPDGHPLIFVLRPRESASR
jgi:DNA-directed RNA polymerase specialized sigma24 family protein